MTARKNIGEKMELVTVPSFFHHYVLIHIRTHRYKSCTMGEVSRRAWVLSNLPFANGSPVRRTERREWYTHCSLRTGRPTLFCLETPICWAKKLPSKISLTNCQGNFQICWANCKGNFAGQFFCPANYPRNLPSNLPSKHFLSLLGKLLGKLSLTPQGGQVLQRYVRQINLI